jgi:8-oxo-dGTP pyrophosphatase MutT (NUDIX family)
VNGRHAADDLASRLRVWEAPTEQQGRLREEYLAFLDDYGPAALRRERGSDHVTASCFIFSADLERTVLCYHRKGRFWVQTGGHVEPGDASVPAAALREAHEEAGLTGLTLVPGALDLDRHALSDAFGTCRTHWDVGFAALTAGSDLLRVSDESEQVGWFPVDDLPVPLASRVSDRLRHLRDAVRQG